MAGNQAVHQNHIVGIDFLRFLAALSVTWFHYGFWTGIRQQGAVGPGGLPFLNFPALYSWTNFGWVGVEIFFVISGFVIAFSSERSTAAKFLVSRIVRLGPAVWICATVTLLFVLRYQLMGTADAWRGYRHSMFFLPWFPWIDGAYWTLGIEIVFYCCVFLLLWVANFHRVLVFAAALGLMSAFYRVAVFCAGDGSALAAFDLPRTAELTLLRHGLFFSIGTLLWQYLCKDRQKWILVSILGLVVAGLLEIDSVNQNHNVFTRMNYSSWTPCLIWLAGLTMMWFSVTCNNSVHRLPQPLLRAVKTLGMMTFPLYLLHQVVGQAVMGLFVLNGMDSRLAMMAGFALAISASWVVACLAEPQLQKITRHILNKTAEKSGLATV